jgi:hypothetical protein
VGQRADPLGLGPAPPRRAHGRTPVGLDTRVRRDEPGRVPRGQLAGLAEDRRLERVQLRVDALHAAVRRARGLVAHRVDARPLATLGRGRPRRPPARARARPARRDAVDAPVRGRAGGARPADRDGAVAARPPTPR